MLLVSVLVLRRSALERERRGLLEREKEREREQEKESCVTGVC